MGNRGTEVGIDELGQALADGAADGNGGQALLGVAAMLAEVQGDQRLDGGPLSGVEVTAVDEVIGERVGPCRGLQAWKAATSWPWSIRPFCRASRPKSKSWSAAMVAMRRASRKASAGGGRMAPDAGGRGRRRSGFVGLSQEKSAYAASPWRIGLPRVQQPGRSTWGRCVFRGRRRMPGPTTTTGRWFLCVCYPKAS